MRVQKRERGIESAERGGSEGMESTEKRGGQRGGRGSSPTVPGRMVMLLLLEA